MNAITRRMTIGALIVSNLVLGVWAQEAPKENPLIEPSSTQWTLSTDDTQLKISVANNRISIDSLKNPKQDWNWYWGQVLGIGVNA